jgi:peptidoglycan-associated lipoprotein
MRRLALLLVAIGLLMPACATAPTARPASVDVTGHWVGVWHGYGIFDIPRLQPASADLRQTGADGYGRLMMDNTIATEAVPVKMRVAGLRGARIRVAVSGSDVTLIHEFGEHVFAVDMTVSGDRMIGVVRDSNPPVELALERVRRPVEAARAPTPPPPPPAEEPAPPAPPPVEVAAVAPEPPAPAESPAPAERPAPATFAAMAELQPIYFDFDRSEIGGEAATTLDRNAQWLQANENLEVVIEGHCDERGTNEYNLALGERRARALRDYLTAHGVDAGRITVISYGAEHPVCSEQSATCWSQNRRGEFLAKPRSEPVQDVDDRWEHPASLDYELTNEAPPDRRDDR